MTKSSDARQNLIGGFRPHEGLGMLIGMGNVSPDGRWSCNLPRQGDTSKGEVLASRWARYRAGGMPSSGSWGRSSLYSCIHWALISRTLLERVEHIGIPHFMPEHPIEPFHKGILTRPARLNIAQSDAVLRTPAGKALRQKFWPIVEAQGLGLSPPGHHLLQHPDHSFSGQRGINLDRETLSHAFIQDIQRSEPASTIERVTHKVHGPHRIGRRHDGQRVTEAHR